MQVKYPFRVDLNRKIHDIANFFCKSNLTYPFTTLFFRILYHF